LNVTGFKRHLAEDNTDDEDEDDGEDESPLDMEASRILRDMYGSGGTCLNPSIDGGAAGTGNHKLLDGIPKKIVKEWLFDGIRNVTIIFALTGGAVDKDSDGIECKITSDGTQFAISEQWSPLMADMAAYYAPVNLERYETKDEFTRRRFNMEDQVKVLLKASGTTDTLVSVYRMPLPFPVDPSSLCGRFHGARDGSRFCHVDLTEKKRLVAQGVQMLDAGRNKPKPGSSEKPKYSSILH
jgi:hypothetical protein